MSIQNEFQPQYISVWINGELKEIPADQSLTQLLDFLSIAGDRIAIEINKSIVRKRDWQQTLVRPGSHVEIVEFVGGG